MKWISRIYFRDGFRILFNFSTNVHVTIEFSSRFSGSLLDLSVRQQRPEHLGDLDPRSGHLQETQDELPQCSRRIIRYC